MKGPRPRVVSTLRVTRCACVVHRVTYEAPVRLRVSMSSPCLWRDRQAKPRLRRDRREIPHRPAAGCTRWGGVWAGACEKGHSPPQIPRRCAPRNPHEPQLTLDHESLREGRRPRRPGRHSARPSRGRGRPRPRCVWRDFLSNDMLDGQPVPVLIPSLRVQPRTGFLRVSDVIPSLRVTLRGGFPRASAAVPLPFAGQASAARHLGGGVPQHHRPRVLSACELLEPPA